MIIIGVDNGNAYTKIKSGKFITGLNKHDVRPSMVNDLIEINENGKDVWYSLSQKRDTYKRDKTKDDATRILTMFAIAKEILSRGEYTDEVIEVALGVGLPPGHWGKNHEEFKKYFLKNNGYMELKYNDKLFKIQLLPDKLYVFPQAYAAVASRPSDLKKYTKTYVIDIGGYTTDVLTLNNGIPDSSNSISLSNGVITMNNAIKNRIDQAYNTSIDESQIEDVLLGRENIISNDMKEIINEEASNYAKEMLLELNEQKISLNITPAIFVGGGSLLIKPFIESSNMVGRCEFIEDQEANAKGYENLMQAFIKQNIGR